MLGAAIKAVIDAGRARRHRDRAHRRPRRARLRAPDAEQGHDDLRRAEPRAVHGRLPEALPARPPLAGARRGGRPACPTLLEIAGERRPGRALAVAARRQPRLGARGPRRAAARATRSSTGSTSTRSPTSAPPCRRASHIRAIFDGRYKFARYVAVADQHFAGHGARREPGVRDVRHLERPLRDPQPRQRPGLRGARQRTCSPGCCEREKAKYGPVELPAYGAARADHAHPRAAERRTPTGSGIPNPWVGAQAGQLPGRAVRAADADALPLRGRACRSRSAAARPTPRAPPTSPASSASSPPRLTRGPAMLTRIRPRRVLDLARRDLPAAARRDQPDHDRRRFESYRWYGAARDAGDGARRRAAAVDGAPRASRVHGEPQAEKLLIVRYPSHRRFLAMTLNPYYLAINRLREAGVRRFEASFTHASRTAAEASGAGALLVAVHFNSRDGRGRAGAGREIVEPRGGRARLRDAGRRVAGHPRAAAPNRPEPADASASSRCSRRPATSCPTPRWQRWRPSWPPRPAASRCRSTGASRAAPTGRRSGPRPPRRRRPRELRRRTSRRRRSAPRLGAARRSARAGGRAAAGDPDPRAARRAAADASRARRPPRSRCAARGRAPIRRSRRTGAAAAGSPRGTAPRRPSRARSGRGTASASALQFGTCASLAFDARARLLARLQRPARPDAAADRPAIRSPRSRR